MSQFNGRALRLLSVLGVFFVVLILFGYHELVSDEPYIASSFRHVSQTIEDAMDGKPKTTARPSTDPAVFKQASSPPVIAETSAASPSRTVNENQKSTPSFTAFDGEPDLRANATDYVQAIMDPDNTSFDPIRILKPGTSTKRSYFFALDFRQKVDLLPRLMGSVVETMRLLGPNRCMLSIVEGHSTDGSFEVLKLLQADLETIGVRYQFVRSDIDPSAGNRIGALADLRNLALEPLMDDPLAFALDTTVVFLNDVAICSEDILELVHQRQALGADMTCGFDWTYVGRDPTFYDVWVARTIHGDSFFEIPPDGNWNSAWNLFWNAPDDRARLQEHKPLQVFSCWNGAAVFGSKPLWDDGVRFRAPREGECFQGEPQLFCKDLWHAGQGKIAVVPSVNLEYDDEHATKIKGLKGYTSQWTGKEEDGWEIEWKDSPPEKVKCMASYETQEWRQWDEGLAGVENK